MAEMSTVSGMLVSERFVQHRWTIENTFQMEVNEVGEPVATVGLIHHKTLTESVNFSVASGCMRLGCNVEQVAMAITEPHFRPQSTSSLRMTDKKLWNISDRVCSD